MTTTPCPTDLGWKSVDWLRRLAQTCQAATAELEPNGVLDMGNRIEDIIPMETQGRVFVRQEFYDFYDRLKASNALMKKGRVVCGSPGIGKSAFLLYVLARRLKEKRTTLFYTRGGDLYLFHSDSVYRLRTRFVADDHLHPLMASEDPIEDAGGCRVWVLIDSGIPSSPPLNLTTPSILFPVHAASPNRQHYGEWMKQSKASRFIMNPWREEELPRMLALYDDPNVSELNEGAVRQAHTKFGPCVRDVIVGLSQPTDLATNIDHALLVTSTVTELIQFAASACESSEHVESMSHQLFFIQRRFPSAIAERTDSDRVVVEVKTLDIWKRLLFKYDSITVAEAQRFCRLCSPFPETSILAGWLFGKIAIKYLSGEASTPGVVQGMYLMKMMEMTNADASPNPSFAYSSSAEDTSQLHVAPWSVTLKMNTEPPVESIQPFHHAEATLPISTRIVTPLNDFAYNFYDYFYVLNVKNHPLFDAAFFSLSHDNEVSLWILQMITSARHGGSDSQNGYDIVRELRRKLGCRCVVNYVLVVPARRHQGVIWNMPLGWQSDVEGPVYVQFLAVDKIFAA